MLATLRKKAELMKPSPPATPDDPPGADAAVGRSVDGAGSGPTGRFLYASGARPLEGYTIKRGVGRGGFGEVYFAQSDAGKEVALKLIRRNLDVELRGVRHCLNLKHPNLVSLYDIRTDSSGDEWVVMEYVSGESLEQLLDRYPHGLPVEQAVAWMRSIARGVAYLHDSGIVHRDLKPGNLFLDKSNLAEDPLPGVVKLGDYGLSKFISCSRRSGQTESVGTVHYMAPEIANGRYGQEIDTYALGVIFYEMLTGSVPFEGESVGEVLMKHLTAEPDLGKLAEPFRTIVSKALAKDPTQRFGSVGELIAMLPGSAPAAAAAPEPMVPLTPSAADDDGVWRPVSTPPHVPQPSQLEPEPLWQGIKDLSHGVSQGWRDWGAPPLAKAILLLTAMTFAVLSSGAWLMALVPIVPLYAIYYMVWDTFIRRRGPVAPPKPTAAATQSSPPTVQLNAEQRRVRRTRTHWRVLARKQLAERSAWTASRELVGSMLVAATICGIAASTAAATMAEAYRADPIALGLWLGVTATLASWGVLAVNAYAETRFEDHAPVRGMLAVVGAGVGLAAWALGGVLMQGAPLDDGWAIEFFDSLIGHTNLKWGDDLNEPGDQQLVSPPAVVSAVYFAALMFACRWQRLANFTRRKRIAFWPIVGCLAWAWGLHLFAWYPQPAALIIAATAALAIQASSHWLPPSKRTELARGV
ncbi:Serine/threonine-protein kinase StkP [Pseudobythopirellula maris]|uniref:Serine/threonine-protein kinase StkP n=1 Tax=Pseudobythopirellula maris TaxID=2527991 RepID=A0A5C5ZMZ7_9BACT|nr:serine/threonine-protein kinase [Pseudobythopirellula maris]TWT88852.1 Serine/threonine-protein kinase StkP [Pseudobythopirellula maris]